MLRIENDRIFKDESPIILLSETKEMISGELIEIKAGINKNEFHDFYRENLLKISAELVIKKEIFQDDEVDFLESLGFEFLSTEYDIEREELLSVYLFKFRETEYIKDEAMKDIIEKLDLN